MGRLGIVAVCLCVGCSYSASIPPAEVPRLANAFSGHGVVVDSIGEGPIEIEKYDRVVLYTADGAHQFVLEPPIVTWNWEGITWVRSAASPVPLQLDPERYSRAEIQYRSGANAAIFAVTVSIVGLLVLLSTQQAA